MKKIILLLLLLATLTACSLVPSSSNTRPKEIDIYAGTSGLRPEFSKNAPPQTVFESSGFPILIKISNLGAYSIPEKSGLLSIAREKDYVPEIYLQENPTSAINDPIHFEVMGKTQSNPDGDEILISLNAKTGNLDPQSESKSSTLTATLCYPYKTILSATTCIDTDIANIRPVKKVCTPSEMIFGRGQGAPITVAKIEPQMIPEGDKVKPQFLIYLENRGTGIPVYMNDYQKICLNEDVPIKNALNVASLKAYSSNANGEDQLECSPSLASQKIGTDESTGYIKFRDKKDLIRCTFKEGISRDLDAYTSPLRIEIDYGYVQTISTSLIIQRPSSY